MSSHKDDIDIVTRLYDSRNDGNGIVYLAKTTVDDGIRYFTEYATGSTRQEAGEKSLFIAINKSGLSIEDVKDNISFLI